MATLLCMLPSELKRLRNKQIYTPMCNCHTIVCAGQAWDKTYNANLFS